jgi:aspartate kinase
MGNHTVEKIGGTSMSAFGDVLDNVIVGPRSDGDYYNRIFVVSAYGGITNLLLEDKKTGAPGVYQYFAANDRTWASRLDDVCAAMCEINAGFADIGLNVADADAFVQQRIDGLHHCLLDLRRLCSYGHFQLQEYLPAVREMLSALGEAHSANNSAMILQAQGINGVLIDLSGWKETTTLKFSDAIREAFHDIDLSTALPIVTGYTKCSEGLMETYDRGYTEITFSKIATVTGAREAIIHKEYHLSSGDPKLVGVDRVRIIGATNYDVADQLADLGMEAIHPKASKGLELLDIPLRVKNVFEPDNDGTLITNAYRSEAPRVEIVTGRTNMIGLEVWDPDMVGQSGYDHRLLSFLAKHRVSYVAKNTNANTITHYIPARTKKLEACVEEISAAYPGAEIRQCPVAIVSAIGSNMKVPGFLSKAANALASADINILAIDQCMRQVNMQFIIRQDDFDAAIVALHRGLIEN